MCILYLVLLIFAMTNDISLVHPLPLFTPTLLLNMISLLYK